MNKFLIITFSILFGLIFLFLGIIFVIYCVDSYRIAHDPTLYAGFQIIEQKQISAEDGMTFYTTQVDTNHPKNPYRLYVFTSPEKKKHLFFVDSYMEPFKPKVSHIADINGESYYLIEDYIVNYHNGNFTRVAAQSLDAFEKSDEEFQEYVPVVKMLVEQGSWFWLHEGAEFLLKSQEAEFVTQILINFETDNQENKEHKEPYYRSTLTYDKMMEKCKETAEKFMIELP